MTGVGVLGIAGLASSWMLLWSAAAAIPIILHLLNRRRQQTVTWAAMRLLLQAIEKQSKRIRFEQLILLAVRTLILLTLAFALARPFLVAENSSGIVEAQRTPRLWILAIDNSYSMGYREEKATRFVTAQARAVEIVQAAIRGDAFALITLSQPSRPIILRPSFDRESTVNAIQRLELLDGHADLGSALRQVNEIIADAKKDARLPTTVEIVLISDLGRDTWLEAVGSGRLARPLKQLTEEHSVTYESLAGQTSSNAAVVALAPTTTRALKDQVLNVDVTVANFGPATLMQLPVQLQVDGQTLESQFLDIPSGASRVVHMQLRPSSTGLTKLSASIRTDRLPVDDQRFAVIEVREVYRVLCVENAFSDNRILKAALQPPISTSSALEVTSTSQIELSTLELENYDALVLNDLPGISESEFQRLRDFVDDGRSVICFFGQNAVAANWNPWLESEADLFGFHLLEPSELAEWKIDPQEYASPIVAPFEAYPDAGLLTTPIFRYWKIQAHGTGDRQLGSEVALQGGGPLIVRYGRNGGLITCLLSAPQTGAPSGDNQAWNAMAAWPSFVPLLQQTVQTALSQSAQNRNLTVGQAFSGALRATENSAQVHVIRPNGSESITQSSDVDAAGLIQWSFSQTMHSGIYQVSSEKLPTQLYAVNLDPVQSDLVSIPLAHLPKSDNKDGDALVAASTGATAQPSQSFARSLLVALATLLVTESVMAWHLGRRL